MTLDEYSHDRGSDFHSCGGDVLLHETEDLAGFLLLIDANIAFGEHGRGLLEITEVVEIRPDGSAHRKRYRYHFAYDGLFVFRYERDAKNHPDMPEHKHAGAEDNRIPSGRMRFSDVVSELYDFTAEVESGPPADA
jgi:hypothetical protein